MGQLRPKRADLFDSNVLSLADEQFFHVDDAGSLHGVSETVRVSLLHCVGGGMFSTTGWDDFSIHHGDGHWVVLPRFRTVLGTVHLGPADWHPGFDFCARDFGAQVEDVGGRGTVGGALAVV